MCRYMVHKKTAHVRRNWQSVTFGPTPRCPLLVCGGRGWSGGLMCMLCPNTFLRCLAFLLFLVSNLSSLVPTSRPWPHSKRCRQHKQVSAVLVGLQSRPSMSEGAFWVCLGCDRDWASGLALSIHRTKSVKCQSSGVTKRTPKAPTNRAEDQRKGGGKLQDEAGLFASVSVMFCT